MPISTLSTWYPPMRVACSDQVREIGRYIHVKNDGICEHVFCVDNYICIPVQFERNLNYIVLFAYIIFVFLYEWEY